MIPSKIIRVTLWVVGFIVGIFGLLCAWSYYFFEIEGLPWNWMSPFTMPAIIFYWKQLPISAAFYLFAPAVLFAVTGLIIMIAPLMRSKKLSLYGDAHWANKSEIKKMGLLSKEGNLIVGKLGNKYLKYRLVNHILVCAPTRSGKGVSLVIPNAFNWPGSMLCTDNKYEIFETTSGYRKSMGHEVYRFSPASSDFKTHRINPLDYINKDNPSQRITDIQLILDVLIADMPGENKMWSEEARSIALGLLLWLMQSDRPFTLSEFAAIIKNDLDTFLTKVIDECVIADNLISIDHAAFLAIKNFLGKASKEQSGVRSTLTSMVRLWEDPLICAATSTSDFDFRDMRKRPISVYLSFGTAQISRLSPLINLIIQLYLNVMLSHLPGEDEPCKVLCLLDEINRFGRMDKLKDGFGDLAGYGVHLMPIIQNIGQFYSTYGGRDQSDIFFQNTDIKVCFRQNAQTDKQFVSNELGNKTVRLKTRSYSTNRTGYNINETYIERPLLSPKEVGRFSMSKQIIITGDGAVKCKKVCYFKDPNFKDKVLPSTSVPKQVPVYPIIDVVKNPQVVDDSQEIKAQIRQEKLQAKEVGGAIAKALNPLINQLTSQASVQKEAATDALMQGLAKTFEGESNEA